MLVDASPYHYYDSNEIELVFYREPTVSNTWDENWQYVFGFEQMGEFNPANFSKKMYMKQVRVHMIATKQNRADIFQFLSYLKEHKIEHAIMPPGNATVPYGLFVVFIDLYATNYGKLTKSPQDFLRLYKHLFTDVFLNVSPVYGDIIQSSIYRYQIYPDANAVQDFYHDKERTISLFQYLFDSLPNVHGRRRLENL